MGTPLFGLIEELELNKTIERIQNRIESKIFIIACIFILLLSLFNIITLYQFFYLFLFYIIWITFIFYSNNDLNNLYENIEYIFMNNVAKIYDYKKVLENKFN